MVLAFIFRVKQPISVFAGVKALRQEQKQVTVELKLTWKLVPHLVNTVQKLDENGRAKSTVFFLHVIASFAEHVPEGQPVLFDQNLEPLYSPVIGIQEHLGQRTELRCAIPAIRAVNHDILVWHLHYRS